MEKIIKTFLVFTKYVRDTQAFFIPKGRKAEQIDDMFAESVEDQWKDVHHSMVLLSYQFGRESETPESIEEEFARMYDCDPSSFEVLTVYTKLSTNCEEEPKELKFYKIPIVSAAAFVECSDIRLSNQKTSEKRQIRLGQSKMK